MLGLPVGTQAAPDAYKEMHGDRPTRTWGFCLQMGTLI